MNYNKLQIYMSGLLAGIIITAIVCIITYCKFEFNKINENLQEIQENLEEINSLCNKYHQGE